MPTTSPENKYSAPLTDLTPGTVVKAIAVKTDMRNSAVATVPVP